MAFSGITDNVDRYFCAFRLIFDDSNICQVYGLTENFLSITDSIIIFSVTKSALTLQKKVQDSIFGSGDRY